jgi:hypothetical protein
VDTKGLFRCSIKNQVEKKNLLVFHTEGLQPLHLWSSQKWHQPGQIASAPVPTSFFVPLSQHELQPQEWWAPMQYIHNPTFSSVPSLSKMNAAEDAD